MLPLFIPFDKMSESEKQRKIYEHFIFLDLFSIVHHNQLKNIINIENNKLLPEDNKKKMIQRIMERNKCDLNALKEYVLDRQALHFLRVKIMHYKVKDANLRKIIAKRFFDIFVKLSAISIDGFKRERYVIKI
jgi:hypothetical protein